MTNGLVIHKHNKTMSKNNYVLINFKIKKIYSLYVLCSLKVVP